MKEFIKKGFPQRTCLCLAHINSLKTRVGLEVSVFMPIVNKCGVTVSSRKQEHQNAKKHVWSFTIKTDHTIVKEVMYSD